MDLLGLRFSRIFPRSRCHAGRVVERGNPFSLFARNGRFATPSATTTIKAIRTVEGPRRVIKAQNFAHQQPRVEALKPQANQEGLAAWHGRTPGVPAYCEDPRCQRGPTDSLQTGSTNR